MTTASPRDAAPAPCPHRATPAPTRRPERSAARARGPARAAWAVVAALSLGCDESSSRGRRAPPPASDEAAVAASAGVAAGATAFVPPGREASPSAARLVDEGPGADVSSGLAAQAGTGRSRPPGEGSPARPPEAPSDASPLESGAGSTRAAGAAEPARGRPRPELGPRAGVVQVLDPDAPPGAPPADVPPLESPPPRDGLVAVLPGVGPAHVGPTGDGLALEVLPGTRLLLDPITGVATLHEVDAALPGGPRLERARSGATDAPGLFGAGWRSDVGGTLHALPNGGLVARRLDGLVRYRRAAEGTWASVWGELERLARGPGGTFEGLDPAGLRLAFDADGRLVGRGPGLRVDRATGGLVRVEGSGGALALALDRGGRVERALGAGVDLRFAYEVGGRLVAVRGDRDRRYEHDPAGRLARVHGPDGLALALAWDEEGRLARADLPARGWAQTYEHGEAWLQVDTPEGRWVYERTDGGWRVETPRGVDEVATDDRLRVLVVRPRGGPAVRVLRDATGRATGVRPLAPGEEDDDGAGPLPE